MTAHNLPIPLVDLKRQYADIGPEIDHAIQRVCREGEFILGRSVEEFERAFADYLGVRHCIGVASGTDALHLIMRTLGIGAGDEVIVPANTFIATAQAVSACGATPVLADCDASTATLNADAVEEALTPRTRAVIPVHLYGQPADLDPLLQLGRWKGLHVIEDAAQAHGAAYRGRKCGTLGIAAGFSFYPGKNLGAYGDGGAVTTNDDEIAAKVRLLRNWGSTRKYLHDEVGFNSRLDSLQAAVLTVKLGRLDVWNQRRQVLVARYSDALQACPDELTPIDIAPWTSVHAHHLFVVRVRRRNRDQLLRDLHSQRIEAGVHYPIPIHLQKAYAFLGRGPGSFPAAEQLARDVLSLPLCPYLTDTAFDSVVATLLALLSAEPAGRGAPP